MRTCTRTDLYCEMMNSFLDLTFWPDQPRIIFFLSFRPLKRPLKAKFPQTLGKAFSDFSFTISLSIWRRPNVRTTYQQIWVKRPRKGPQTSGKAFPWFFFTTLSSHQFRVGQKYGTTYQRVWAEKATETDGQTPRGS